MLNNTSLLIPDGHVDDEQDLLRWACAGNLIVERKPDVIVQLGDFVTIHSLSFFDMHVKGKMENLRYAKEMTAGREAMGLLFGPMNHYNAKMRKQHGQLYNPKIIWIEGNHEYRVTRYLDSHPHLKGQLDLALPHNLNYDGYPIDVVIPYKEFITLDGISYTHAPINAACKPVQGKYALFRATELFATSVVFGHTHRKEQMNTSRHGCPNPDNITQTFTAGCFFEHVDDYAKFAKNVYWRGLQLLHSWGLGRFDVEEISMARLRNDYK